MADRGYATKVEDSPLGTVNKSERRIIQIDVWTNPLGNYESDMDAEYVINVNGHTLKRMTFHQAIRMGIVAKD